MSSSEDMFSDSPEMDPEDFTPPSSLSAKTSQGSKLNPTPEFLTDNEQVAPKIGSEESSGIPSEPISVNIKKPGPNIVKMKVEFYDESDEKLFSRVSTDLETINITTSMLRSS